MRKTILTSLSLCLFAATAAFADQPAASDPIGDSLFPPELVMSHQQAVNLSDAQRSAIEADMQEAQGHFTHAQWQLSGAMERLVASLKQSHVNETQALQNLSRTLDLEREIKNAQLTLMVRIKNELTPQQQDVLRHLR